MSDFDDESLNNLTKEEVEDIESAVEMEFNFFRLLSGTDKVEIIPIPDEDGDIITPEQLDIVQKECKRQKIKLLYRMVHISHSTIFDPDTKLTGVVPDNNHRGFYC